MLKEIINLRKSNTTLLIQGKLTEDAIEHNIKNLMSTGIKVIVSIWSDNNIDLSNLPPTVKIIINDLPSNEFHQNMKLEVMTTMTGLKLVDTEYCIKIRGDEYFSNLDYILKSINPEKIVTSPIFFEKNSCKYSWHMGYNLLLGKTSDLIDMYTTDTFGNNMEELLTINYLEKRGVKCRENYIENMINYFEILDIKKLENYKLADIDPSQYDCANTITDLYDMRKKCTILVQGRLTPESYKYYTTYYTDIKVIISTWNNNTVEISPIPSNFTVLLNSMPSDELLKVANSHQNMELQVMTTMSGLKLVDTEYCIKMRGDEYWGNLDYMLSSIKHDKIVTSPVFFRKMDCHISDHLIIGRTKNLIDMFSVDECRFNVEQVLTHNYLNKKGINENDHFKNMIYYFDIIDIEKLKDYRVCYNGRGLKWLNNFIPRRNNSANKIEEIYI